MLRLTSFFLFAVFFAFMAHAETAFRQLHIDENTSRPLNVAVWYATPERGKPTTVGDNIVFEGTQALLNARPASGPHPLLLLSHGYGGSWRNLNWLASLMAEQGYIVAAVDHPGTTTRDKNEQDARQLWRRPQDLLRVTNGLIASPEIAGEVDTQRIAAVGHSLGGWTVIEMAGGRFDVGRFQSDCRHHAELAGCKLIRPLGIDGKGAGKMLAAEARDPRIKAVVSLDLGLARGFSPASLQHITIPVLIMAAQADSDELPAKLESGWLAVYIPGAKKRYVSVEGATHFSFMQLCKPGAVALIEEENPGEGIVCQDGPSASRAAIHQRLGKEISAFVNQALAYRPPHGGNPSGSSR